MPTPPLSRRAFLKTTGITLGASALTCSGLGYLVTRTPKFYPLDRSYGKENTMNTRILVTYATRAGSTVDVAAAIGATLAGRGFLVDVKAATEKPSLDIYQAAVLGSAIRMGAWLPEAVEFIQANQTRLRQMPTALYTVHMLNIDDSPASAAARQAYISPVLQMLTPESQTFFAGKMDYSRLSFLDRVIAKAVEKSSGAKEGDLRDWNAIQTWAGAVLGSLN